MLRSAGTLSSSFDDFDDFDDIEEVVAVELETSRVRTKENRNLNPIYILTISLGCHA